MKPCALIFVLLATLVYTGCSIAPYTFPENAAKFELRAIDATLITVKKEFRYSPSLTSYVLPAGDYVPIRTDANGTYYGSSKGILVMPVAGSAFLVEGGIYRRKDSSANYPFAVYVNMPALGWQFVDLHSLWGLNLNENIECTPPYVFN